MKISSICICLRLIYLTLFCVYSISGFAQNSSCCNILPNGDFEQGDTLFTSGLTKNCTCTANSYCVGTNFQDKCSGWHNFNGNNGIGQFLIIDGSPFGPVDVWQNSVVIADEGEYCFSFWVASQYASAFDLGFMINGAIQGGPFTVSQSSPIWTEYSGTVYLTTGTHNIAIHQLTGGGERDFGIDDISFGASVNAGYIVDLSINCGAHLHFINISSGPAPLTYSWDFGDPASGSDNFSNLQNPDHLFTSCGEFEVCLIAISGTCRDTTCHIVLVDEVVPPDIICPPFIILDCDDDLDPLNTGFATATDNCDTNPTIQYSDAHFGNIPCGGEIIRTWTAMDFCGNVSECEQNIIVIDDVPPIITCPADISLNCDDDIDPLNTGFATATDNCDTNPTIQYSDAHFGNIPCGGEIIRTWTAMDFCGNISTCDQIIIVNDNIPPVITGCPSDITIVGTIINGICEADVSILSPIATDNCDNNVTLDNDFNGLPDASGLYQMGTTLVIWTATDDCGNTATCSFSVTVQCLNDCCECGLNGTNGPNQIVNGNFALGDNNFTSDILSVQNCIPGTYYIGQTFNDKCNLWPTTTGKKDCYLNSTNFLIIDGVAGGPSPTTLWRQPITVVDGMTYCFSVSTRSLYTQQNFTLDVKIFDSSGNQVGQIVGNPTVSGNLWVDHTYTWNCTTSGTFDLEIIQTSNGHFRDFGMDDICFSKVIPQDCCENFDSFCATVENAINFSVNHDSCKVTFQIGSLPDCDYIEWVNWGDGNQSFGNFESGDMPMHVYSGSGTYVICYLAIERDLDSLICFEKIICDTIELQCDACICHSDLTLTHGSNNIPVNCNTSFLHVFQCPIEDVSISGYFGCINPTSGLPCTSGPVSWKLDRPGGQSTIIGSQSNFQPLTFQASDLAVSGIYVLLLSTICPGSSDTCFCRISWLQEDCEDSCCIDFDIFLAAAASVQPNVQISNCSINANPTGLNDCMQITWDWGDGSPLDGPYFNNTSVSHTYSGNGIYTACFTIIEFSVYGDSCWSTKFCFEVECKPCVCPGSNIIGPNLIVNGDFSLGHTGFTSGQVGGPGNPCACNPPGTYCIGMNLTDKCPGWPSVSDHTGDLAANFLIVDGNDGRPGSLNVWAQSVNIQQCMTYCFSFWTASVYNTPFNLNVVVYDVAGNPVSPLFGTANIVQTAPPWSQHSFTWTAPCNASGPFTIAINQVAGDSETDFGIDDICLSKIETPPDSCECGTLEWAEVYGISPLPQPISCDTTALIIPCRKFGSEFFIHGNLTCASDTCGPDVVSWILNKPGNLADASGIAIAPYPHFDIGIPWSEFSQGGSYTLTVTRNCGSKQCSCKFNFILEDCQCGCDDLADDVNKGFVVTGNKNSCIRKFKPVALCPGDKVTWLVNGPGLNGSFGPTVGNGSTTVSFPSPGGTYSVCMFVTRFDPLTGDTCLGEFCRNIIVKCKGMPNDTNPSITTCPGGDRLLNGDFTEGLIAGHLGKGGAIMDWSLFPNDGDGIVFVEDSTGASDDGHIVLIGGEDNFAGIYQEVNLTGDSIYIGFYAINYLGSDLPAGTALEFRLHKEPIQGPHQIIWRYIMDTSSLSWVEVSLAIPIEIDPSLHFLVICVQNENENERSVVGIDNIEFCTDATVSTYYEETQRAIRIFPNPNTGEFIVDFLDLAPIGATLRIISLTGQVLSEKKFENNNQIQNVNADMLPAGMYIIQIISDGQVTALSKLVKM